QGPGREVVDDVDLLTLGQEPLDQAGADEAGPAGDEHPHETIPPPGPGASTRAPVSRSPGGTTAPGPTMVTPDTAAPASTWAPAATTESVTSAPAPMWAPSNSTDRRTLAPASNTAPAPSTEPSTAAPGATAAPGPMSDVPPLRARRSALASRYLAG